MGINKIGQYFTEDLKLQQKVFDLCSNKGNALEPSAGVGHLVSLLEEKYTNILALELDTSLTDFVCKTKIIFGDFLDLPVDKKFNTIFGNPPYLKYRELPTDTLSKLNDFCIKNCNIFYYFIEKCFSHLNFGGELIFIIPREFMNSTRACKLRQLLYDNGTITHVVDYEEQRLFKNVAPNIIIIRYEKDNFSHITSYEYTNSVLIKKEILHNGAYLFLDKVTSNKTLSRYFDIKVGLVTGLNEIYEYDTLYSIPMICSDFCKTGIKRYFIFVDNVSLGEIKQKDGWLYEHLLINKDTLLNRGIKKFNEDNWYFYGAVRNIEQMEQQGKCIYVNAKTRNQSPFYIHDRCYYDGAVLALYPKEQTCDLDYWCSYLNNNIEDFKTQGMYVNNKYSFTVKTLSDLIIQS
jgi:adenine-specific DNA-methyltransferase